MVWQQTGSTVISQYPKRHAAFDPGCLSISQASATCLKRRPEPWNGENEQLKTGALRVHGSIRCTDKCLRSHHSRQLSWDLNAHARAHTHTYTFLLFTVVMLDKVTKNTELLNTKHLLQWKTLGWTPENLWSHFHQLINTYIYFMCLFLFQDISFNVYCD